MSVQDYATIIAVARLRANLTLDDGQDLGGMLSTELILLIDDALDEYSKDRARRITLKKDETDLNSSNQLKLTDIIAGQTWDPVTDSVSYVENPIDQPKTTKMNRHEDYNDRYESEGDHFIQFFRNPSDEFRVKLLVHWTVASATADPRAKRMVGINAAAKAARVKEGKFADMRDSALDADTVDYEGKAALWDSLATSLEEEYARGLKRPDEVKESVNRVRTVDLDARPQHLRRGRYLVHRPDLR